MNGVLWYGWMYGRKDEEAELRALGVMGPMGWHPDAEDYDHNNYAHLEGVFTHCTCTEATMYRLLSDRRGFNVMSFTGAYVETGEQLPRDLQKFTSMEKKTNWGDVNFVFLADIWKETFPDRPKPNLVAIQ